MKVNELQAKFAEVTGETTRSPNKTFLVRRITEALQTVGVEAKAAEGKWFDGTGLCLLAKRLEKGRCAPLWERSELTTTELLLFLEGSTAVGRVALSPEAFDLERDGRVIFSG